MPVLSTGVEERHEKKARSVAKTTQNALKTPWVSMKDKNVEWGKFKSPSKIWMT
jgi:hypothetical protein